MGTHQVQRFYGQRSASIVFGWVVMMSPAVVPSVIPFFSSIRRRSPSVMTPISLPSSSVTAVAPNRLDVISMMTSRSAVSGVYPRFFIVNIHILYP
jgi:hypothetical protein